MRRLLCYIFCLGCGSAAAAPQFDPEWPCIQVLVPEIVAAVVWPQPIPEALTGSWRNDASIAALAQKLSDLESFNDSERQTIAEFAESIPAAERSDQLNRLAEGIITYANQRRKQYIRGIKRYTRQQMSIATQIEETLNQLSAQEQSGNSKAMPSRTVIEETLNWHQRVYDQRERAIQSLCERPVELEEILSNVLREMAQYLP